MNNTANLDTLVVLAVQLKISHEIYSLLVEDMQQENSTTTAVHLNEINTIVHTCSSSFDSGKVKYREIFQLLRHMTSFVGVFTCTACKKITTKKFTNWLDQTSWSEILIYSSL